MQTHTAGISVLTRAILFVSLLQLAPAQSGTVKCKGADCQDGEFHIAFPLPPKWKVENQNRWTDAGEPANTVNLYDPKSIKTAGLYYRLFVNPVPSSAEELSEQLQVEVAKKVSLRERQGLTGYRIKPENCEHRQVGKMQALSCIAEFVSGRKIEAEYLTWIRTERCLAQFWAYAAPDKIPALRSRMEDLIQSLQLP